MSRAEAAHIKPMNRFNGYVLLGAAGAMVVLASGDVGKAACDQLPGSECELPKMTVTSSTAATVEFGNVFYVENPIAGDDFKAVVDWRAFSGAVTDTTSGAIFSRFG